MLPKTIKKQRDLFVYSKTRAYRYFIQQHRDVTAMGHVFSKIKSSDGRNNLVKIQIICLEFA